MLPDAIELRRAIHRHPELGLELPRTQAAVLDALARLGLEVRTGDAVSSVVADLAAARDGDAPVILLRGDMDALPMPEDTGLDVRERGRRRDARVRPRRAHRDARRRGAAARASAATSLPGTVRFMFQPGEEGFHGARYMIDEGVLDDPHVDAAFALHVAPNLPSGSISTRGGPLMASADVLEIIVTGKGGHASTPYLANDPMPVAAEIVQALQVMVTRRINTFDPVVITITKIRAGTTDNVIPETVDMLGTLRAVSEHSRALAIDGIERVVDVDRGRARDAGRASTVHPGLSGHGERRRVRAASRSVSAASSSGDATGARRCRRR